MYGGILTSFSPWAAQIQSHRLSCDEWCCAPDEKLNPLQDFLGKFGEDGVGYSLAYLKDLDLSYSIQYISYGRGAQTFL